MVQTDIIIGITLGDPSGIGPEITIKALSLRQLWDDAKFVVMGSRHVLVDTLNIVGSEQKITEIDSPTQARGYGHINLIECGLPKRKLQYGKVSCEGGEAAYAYVTHGINLALQKKIGAIVTGPLHKEALTLAGYPYAGHTEILANQTKTKHYAMMLVADSLRVVHVSTHVSLREACNLVTKDRVLETIRLTWRGLQQLGIERPCIGVTGLNPHCGEGGLFGDEEIKGIIPAIEIARKHGLNIEGPLPADTAYVKGRDGQYDAIVAMYHDQGHIPVKMVGFSLDAKTGAWSSVGGVNITLGLPIIRTSVDHGVAFDKAGMGQANPQSMVEAIKTAISMCKTS